MIALSIFCVMFSLVRASLNNNWAIVVDSSKYWFNYRHMTNAASLYNEIIELGIPEQNIVMMSGIGNACDSRNSCPGRLFNDKLKTSFSTKSGVFSPHVEIDYTGEDANVANLMTVLTGRHEKGMPTSKRLLSNEASNLIVFLTGHGGDEFFKFQDFEEISSGDFGLAMYEMKLKNRFDNLLFIVDTCQASTLLDGVNVPGLTVISSSAKEENSYAYLTNTDLGVSVIDRFSYSLFTFLQQVDFTSKDSKAVPTLDDMFRNFNPRFLKSTPVLYQADDTRALKSIRLSEFFESTIDLILLPHKKNATRPTDERREIHSFSRDRVATSRASFMALENSMHLEAKDLPFPDEDCSLPTKPWQQLVVASNICIEYVVVLVISLHISCLFCFQYVILG